MINTLSPSLLKRSLSNLALAGLTGLQPLPARAEVESVLRPLPQDAMSTTVIDLSPRHWQFLFGQPGVKSLLMDKELQEIETEIKNELGLSFAEILLELGSHLSISAYPAADDREAPDFVFALELKSSALFDKMRAHLRQLPADQKAGIRSETFQDQELLVFVGKGETPQEKGGMTLQGKTLLISSQVSRLKQILGAPAGAAGMQEHPEFQRSYQALKSDPVVFWLDLKPLKSAEQASSFRKELAEIGLTEQVLALYQSLGVGLRFNEQGLAFKHALSFSSEGLTGSQLGYLKAVKAPQASLEPLLALMPARPLFSGLTNTLQLTFQSPVLSEPAEDARNAGWTRELTELIEEVQQGTGLHLKKDILTYNDGRMALSVFYPEYYPTYKQAPALVVMLGVKDGPAFFSNFQKKLRPPLVSEGKAPLTPVLQPEAPYHGTALYSFSDNRPFQNLGEELKLEVQPCFAQFGQVFLAGNTCNALRASLDYAQGRRQGLLADEQFRKVRSQMAAQSEINLMYSDLTRWVRLLDHFFHAEKIYQDLKPLLIKLQSLAGDGALTPTASTGHLRLDASFDQVDFAKLAEKINQWE